MNTPGPWRVGLWGGQCHIKHGHGFGKCVYDMTLDPNMDNHVSAGSADRPLWICRVGQADCEASAEDVANARLIANAPELLASLREVLADASWELERPIIKRAEAVIAKCESK